MGLLLLLLLVLISFGGALGVFVSLFLLSLMADTTFGLDGRTDARGDGYFSCHVPFLVHSVCQLGVLPLFFRLGHGSLSFLAMRRYC